jgi:hypothetical protein
VKKAASDWNVYRTRFLVKAKQLTAPMAFVDSLGREHQGERGDYLMESYDGLRRIVPRKFFEDAYVSMHSDRNSDLSAGDSSAGQISKKRPGRVAMNVVAPSRRSESIQPTA